ncbi:MAG TPA: zinc-ribbon domain-containing protein [Bacilli bacterium]|nr:zinc-ribbon domain-containing protein [Bacilli bacterium]
MKFCENCGTEVIEGKLFCENCGHIVKKSDPQKERGKTLGIISICTSIIPVVGLIIGIVGLKKSTGYWDKVLNQIGIGLSFLFFSIALGGFALR